MAAVPMTTQFSITAEPAPMATAPPAARTTAPSDNRDCAPREGSPITTADGAIPGASDRPRSAGARALLTDKNRAERRPAKPWRGDIAVRGLRPGTVAQWA